MSSNFTCRDVSHCWGASTVSASPKNKKIKKSEQQIQQMLNIYDYTCLISSFTLNSFKCWHEILVKQWHLVAGSRKTVLKCKFSSELPVLVLQTQQTTVSNHSVGSTLRWQEILSILMTTCQFVASKMPNASLYIKFQQYYVFNCVYFKSHQVSFIVISAIYIV